MLFLTCCENGVLTTRISLTDCKTSQRPTFFGGQYTQHSVNLFIHFPVRKKKKLVGNDNNGSLKEIRPINVQIKMKHHWTTKKTQNFAGLKIEKIKIKNIYFFFSVKNDFLLVSSFCDEAGRVIDLLPAPPPV